MPSELDEFVLIARYFAPLSRDEPGAFGLTDDAAVLALTPGMNAVVTSDLIISGVHFPADDDPQSVATRLIRVNLSDIAAMGATPRAYTLSLALPGDTREDWVAAFAKGLSDDQRRFGITLIGGDTTRSDNALMLSLTMLGEVAADRQISRSGASPNDDIYVTGSIGDAALGLALLQGRLEAPDDAARTYLVRRFRTPVPRVEVGQRLSGVASAATDISDGLVADVNHICQASGVSAEIELARVPLSSAAERLVTDDQPLRASLLSAGDDYELVFTAPAAASSRLQQVAAESGVVLTRIGRIIGTDAQPHTVIVRDAAGQTVEVGDGGYRHFRRKV